MKAQTPEQKVNLSIEIESLINTDLKNDVAFYVKRYKSILELRLGMTEDDIINDIREQVWKGLLTWKSNGPANKKTYITSLLHKRFMTLLKRTTAEKHNAIMYYADVFNTLQSHIDKQYIETQETGEDVLRRRQEAMRDLQSLSKAEKMIYPDLLTGKSISEIMKDHKLDRIKVVRTINKINSRIVERRRNSVKGII